MAEPTATQRTGLGHAEQAALLHSILESSTEYSIVAMDAGGTIVAWNEGARRIYGWQPDEVIGKANALVLHDPADVSAGRAKAVLEEARQTGKWEGNLRACAATAAGSPRT